MAETGGACTETRAVHSVEARIASVGRQIDLRVLLVGSLLPDIIDKPVGRLAFGTFGCRLFSHSLLFLMVIAFAGLCLYLSRHKSWLLVLGFGILIHLVLDTMWLDVHTLLWPLQGSSFPAVERTGWEQGVLHKLFTLPSVYVPELLGVAILAHFAWLLVHHGKTYAFIRHGQPILGLKWDWCHLGQPQVGYREGGYLAHLCNYHLLGSSAEQSRENRKDKGCEPANISVTCERKPRPQRVHIVVDDMGGSVYPSGDIVPMLPIT